MPPPALLQPATGLDAIAPWFRDEDVRGPIHGVRVCTDEFPFPRRPLTGSEASFELQVPEDQFLRCSFFNQTDRRANVVRFAQNLSSGHSGSDRIAAIRPGRAKIAAVNGRQRSVTGGH